MWWGGLRGAVGFALAIVLSEDLWYREIFVTTALVKVLFTVFLQGSTIRLLVEKLKINLQTPREFAIGVEIQNKVMEDTKKGVLAICGNTTTNGAKRGYLASKWNLVDQKAKELLLQKSSNRVRMVAPTVAVNTLPPSVLAQDPVQAHLGSVLAQGPIHAHLGSTLSCARLQSVAVAAARGSTSFNPSDQGSP